SGIGLATVKKFLEEGSNVVLVDINEEEMDLAVKELEGYEDQLRTFIGDITDKAAADAVVNDTVDNFGSLDILVNNAGVTADAQLLKMEEEQWEKVIDVRSEERRVGKEC